MEDKEFMKKYILNNPFEFKQGIISHCREMDKIDVYNWIAEDELKIDKLEQENKQLKEKMDCDLQWAFKYEKQVDNWNKLKEYIKETKLKEFEKSYGKRYGKTFAQAEIIVCNMILDKMQELAKGDSNEFMD